MEEWKTYKIEDLLLIPCRNGLTKPSRIRGNGVKMIGMGELFANTIISGIDMPRVPVSEKELNDSSIYIDDLLFARQSLTLEGAGKCSIVKEVTEPTVFESHLIRLRINPTIADPWFVYYYFNSPNGKHQIANIVNQVAAAGIRGSELIKISIDLPSLETQKKITHCLKSLDNKIELNNRINHNLEAQTQALYKSWFVDFEPFKDGEFVESELGIIPKGWRVGCYNDIISDTVSGDWGKEVETGNYTHRVSCIRGCDFSDVSSGVRGKTPERYILEKNFKNKRLLDKDIIVEISGGTPTVSTGRICLVSNNLLEKYSGDLVCTNFCRVIRPEAGYSSYVFYSWLNKYNNKVMFGYENGTSGIKNFQISDFLEKEPILIPPQTVITKFQTLVDVYQAAIQRNGNERMECETVRDTVLPKLMSGKMNVNEIDC